MKKIWFVLIILSVIIATALVTAELTSSTSTKKYDDRLNYCGNIDDMECLKGDSIPFSILTTDEIKTRDGDVIPKGTVITGLFFDEQGG